MISVTITDKPSNCTARYAVLGRDGLPIINSSTGDKWLSEDCSVEAAQRERITILTQIIFPFGEGPTAKEEKSGRVFDVIAAEGATCRVTHEQPFNSHVNHTMLTVWREGGPQGPLKYELPQKDDRPAPQQTLVSFVLEIQGAKREDAEYDAVVLDPYQ